MACPSWARLAPVGQGLPQLGTTPPKKVSLCPTWASSDPKGQASPQMGQALPHADTRYEPRAALAVHERGAILPPGARGTSGVLDWPAMRGREGAVTKEPAASG